MVVIIINFIIEECDRVRVFCAASQGSEDIWLFSTTENQQYEQDEGVPLESALSSHVFLRVTLHVSLIHPEFTPSWQHPYFCSTMSDYRVLSCTTQDKASPPVKANSRILCQCKWRREA